MWSILRYHQTLLFDLIVTLKYTVEAAENLFYILLYTLNQTSFDDDDYHHNDIRVV